MKAVFMSVFFGLVLLGSRGETIVKKVLIDKSGTVVLVVTSTKKLDNSQEEIKKCQLLTARDEVHAVLQSTPYSYVQQATNEEIQEAIADCSVSASKGGKTEARPEQSGSNTTEGYSGVPVVLPGTKWCGAGFTAEEKQDLGLLENSDRCCRAHDLCDDTLAPGETRNNLSNKSTFTKLNCKCDQEFYECLEDVDSPVSNSIGNLYFNILARECYEYDHPPKACKHYNTFLRFTCKEYEKDTSAPKEWQWVAAKRYTRIPLPLPPETMTLDFDFGKKLKTDKLKAFPLLS